MVVVSRHGRSLQHVDESLQRTKSVVLAAVTAESNTELALSYASARLRDDVDVVYAAVGRSAAAIEFAGEKPKSSLKVLRRVALIGPAQLRHANREGMRKVLERAGGFLEHVHPDLQNDRDLVLLAVQTTPYALRFASQQLRNDTQIVHAALMRDGRVLQFATRDRRQDVDTVLKAVQNNGTTFEFSMLESPEEVHMVARAAAWQDPRALGYMPIRLVFDFIREGGELLETIAQALQEIHTEQGMPAYGGDYNRLPDDPKNRTSALISHDQKVEFLTLSEANHADDMRDDARMASLA